MNAIQQAPVSYYAYPGLRKNVLNLLMSKECKNDKANQLMKLVAEYYRIPIAKIPAHDRKREYCEARMIFIHICFYTLRFNKSELGDMLDRDHTTIIHSLHTIEDLMCCEDRFQKEINLLSAKLYEIN